MLFVAEDRRVGGADDVGLAYFVGIAHPPAVHDDSIAITQPLQAREGPGVAARERNVSGDHAVAGPRGEGGPSKVAGLIHKPGDVPPISLERHPDNFYVYAEWGDLEPYSSVLFVCLGF